MMVCPLFEERIKSFNHLSPQGDENEISLYNINTCLDIKTIRIKKVITKDEMS